MCFILIMMVCLTILLTLGTHARGLLLLSCVSVYMSVPALAASASVETSKQRYSRVSLRLFLDFDRWIFEKSSIQKLWREKANMQMSFRALSGPRKGSNNLKDDCLVEYCVKD